ncbi:MAG: hypothetical protein Ct9H300mP28_08200 [Pseudomonadota bacterium]|nr:MAG: hypothetical protein Ct9H300mP28_08200 [Pseudomonadota bacterium]
MGSDDWLVIDGGNTHFWSEIAINMAGWRGKKLKGSSSRCVQYVGSRGALRHRRQAKASSR